LKLKKKPNKHQQQNYTKHTDQFDFDIRINRYIFAIEGVIH